jgi:hypothetical protein
MIVGITLKDGSGYPRFAQTWLATDDRIMETKRPPVQGRAEISCACFFLLSIEMRFQEIEKLSSGYQ